MLPCEPPIELLPRLPLLNELLREPPIMPPRELLIELLPLLGLPMELRFCEPM